MAQQPETAEKDRITFIINWEPESQYEQPRVFLLTRRWRSISYPKNKTLFPCRKFKIR